MFKLTTAFIAAAALLSATAQADPLQCHMQAFNANIISVDAYSANDLSDKHAPLGASGYFADVTLTGTFFLYKKRLELPT